MAIKAIIFDMDGTLVDSEPLHQASYLEVVRQTGLNVSDDFTGLIGKPPHDVIRDLMSGFSDSDEHLQMLVEQKSVLYRSKAAESLEMFPGALEVLKSLKDSGFKLAIGTSGSRTNVDMVMSRFGLSDYLDTFACMSDVMRGKPSPDIFLKAAERLGVEPYECVVIEDAKLGIKAARAAGMKCIAVATSFPGHELTEADLVLQDVSRLNNQVINSLDTQEAKKMIKNGF